MLPSNYGWPLRELVQIALTLLGKESAVLAWSVARNTITSGMCKMMNEWEGSHLQAALRGRIRTLERQLDASFPACYDAVIKELNLTPEETQRVERAISRVEDRLTIKPKPVF